MSKIRPFKNKKSCHSENVKSFSAKFSNFILGEATDVEGLKRIQVLKTGTFSDPRYGKFEITSKMLSEMIENFKKGIRGVIPALDFGHDSEGRAAGWIKNLFLSDDGTKLFADVELSGSGKQAIESKDYGYISAEFQTKYKDNETNTSHGVVLLGAALTNRPVIKGMESVLTLSETIQKEKEMNEEQQKLLESMGFKTIEELADAYKAMKDKSDAALADAPKKEEEMKKLSESFTETEKKLSEANEKIKALEASVANGAKEQEFSKLLSEGKAVPAQKDAFMKGDVAEFAKHASKVKLSEQGSASEQGADSEDAIIEKATKLSEEKKISFREAYKQVKGGK